MNVLEVEALKFAWHVLEEERNAAADSFIDESDPQKAAAQYLGYVHAMGVLARRSEINKTQTKKQGKS